MNFRKRFAKLLASPNNVRFNELVALVEAFGFRAARTTGGHHIYNRPDVSEQINLQNVGGKAKPYQVRQFLKLVERYNLTLDEQ